MEKTSSNEEAIVEDNSNLKEDKDMPSIVQKSKRQGQRLVVAVKGVKDAVSAKGIGKAIGSSVAFVARPAVSFYDGVREGFNKRQFERLG